MLCTISKLEVTISQLAIEACYCHPKQRAHNHLIHSTQPNAGHLGEQWDQGSVQLFGASDGRGEEINYGPNVYGRRAL